MMPRIIGALLPYAPSDQDSDDAAATAVGKRRAHQWKEAGAEGLLEVLSFLPLTFRGHSEPVTSLDSYRIKLMPFPADRKCFSRIRAGHLKVRGTLSIEEELGNFLDSGQQRLSVASQMLELGHLREVLKANKAALMSKSNATVRGMVPRVVGELLSRCSLVGDVGKEVVAQCLGELGAYNLDMVALPQRAEDIRLLVGGGGSTKVASDTREDLTEEFEAFVLERLIDMDAHIVQAAARCLNVLLEDAGSAETLTSGPLRTKELMWLQREEPAHIAEMVGEWSKAAKAPFAWNATWSPLKVDYDTWIKRLTHVLITPMVRSTSSRGAKQVDNLGIDSSLIALLPLCHQRAEICEKVLPHVILALLRRDHSQQRKLKLSKRINQFFKEVNAATSQSNQHQLQETTPTLKKSIATMINVVNLLRCTKVERSVSRGTGTPAKSSKRQRTSTGGAADTTHWDSLQWLDLNYLEVAGAAARCSAHFTALFYAELWCETNTVTVDTLVKALSGTEHAHCRDLLVEASRGIGEPDSIYGILHTALETRSLVQLYEHEGAWDRSMAIHDFESHDRSEAAASSSRFSNMAAAAAQVQTLGIARGLRAMGYEHVLGVFLDGAVSAAETPPHFHAELAQHQFASAWRNALWDPTGLDRSLVGMRAGTLAGHNERFGVSQALCRALSSFAANDHEQVRDIVQSARGLVMKMLMTSSTESTSSLYPTLVQLQSLVEIEEVSDNLALDANLERSWDLRLAATDLGWDTREPILALRSVLLGVALRRQAQEGDAAVLGGGGGGGVGGGNMRGGSVARCSEMLAKALADQARIGRKAGHTQAAFVAAATMDKMCADRRETEYRASLIRCQCHWERGEESLAKRMLHDLLTRIHKSDLRKSQIHAVSMRTLGKWLAITRSETPNKILDEYLNPAVDHLDQLLHSGGGPGSGGGGGAQNVGDDLAEAHLTLAQYADEQYKMKAQIDNDPWLAEAVKEYAAFREQKEKTQAERHRQISLQRAIDQEKTKRKVLQKDRHHFLRTATTSYLKCLSSGDLFDMHIFRVCSLWFNAPTTNSFDSGSGGGGGGGSSSKTTTESELVSKIIGAAVSDGTLKSYKWLRIMYQLAARLGSTESDPLQQALHRLIVQVAEDHPHHALFVLIALRNGNYKHPEKRSGSSSLSKAKKKKSAAAAAAAAAAASESPLIRSAREILNELRTKAPSPSVKALSRSFQLKEVVEGMEQLSDYYIALADLDVTEDSKNLKRYKGRFDLADVHNNRKKQYIRHLNKLAVVSHNLPVDPSCKYREVPGIQEFKDEFSAAGGVNLPKILECKGTDGKAYKQLVKGHDDMRQDAVMQQAFGMVNGWLEHDAATRKRRLNIGTYKVVPLSQLSGVLEWCAGTQPIGQFLMRDKPSAHERYRPNDFTHLKCRKMLDLKTNPMTKEKKLKVYREITANFKRVKSIAFRPSRFSILRCARKMLMTREALCLARAESGACQYWHGLQETDGCIIALFCVTFSFRV